MPVFDVQAGFSSWVVATVTLLVGSLADLLSLTPAVLAIAAIGLLAAGVLGFFVPETLERHPVAAPS